MSMCGFEPGLLINWANYYETKQQPYISTKFLLTTHVQTSGAENRIYAHYLQSYQGYMVDGDERQNLKWNGFFVVCGRTLP